MIVATTTTVRLDRVQEHTAVQQYESDSNWVKFFENTDLVVFKHVWPTYNVEGAYISTEGK